MDVAECLLTESPYSFAGTQGPWDEAKMRRAFSKLELVEVDASEQRRMTSSLLNLSMGAQAMSYSNMNVFADSPTSSTFPDRALALKVTKVGLLSRKDVSSDSGKRISNRKWRKWSVVLTGSQLMLFRDVTWAAYILELASSIDGQCLLSSEFLLKPDELLSVKGAVAVNDGSYDKVSLLFSVNLRYS